MFPFSHQFQTGEKSLNFDQTPQHRQLLLAIYHCLRVWSNQPNTHFCDRASMYLLPFAKKIFADSQLIKLRPKGVNFHEVIYFDNDKVLDTQLRQFGISDDIADRYIYPRPFHNSIMRKISR